MLKKVKIADELVALEKLGKHLGMFNEKQPPRSAENPLVMLIQQIQGSSLKA